MQPRMLDRIALGVGAVFDGLHLKLAAQRPHFGFDLGIGGFEPIYRLVYRAPAVDFGAPVGAKT